MGERNIRGGRVLLAATLTILLLGCVYGPGYYGRDGYGYDGYGYDNYGYNGGYIGGDPGRDIDNVLIGPAFDSLSHLPLIGPVVGAVIEGTTGYYGPSYNYDDPYYRDPYGYERQYDRGYYDDYGYDPYYPR